jgi:integrase
MARQINKLSTVKINALKVRGFYADGGGLYLQVSPAGTKSWVFRYKGARADGKARDMGLGPLHTISLSEARDLATECRKLRLQGIDPIEKRDAERSQRQLDAAKLMTFDQCSAAYIADNSVVWRNPKHRQQWTNTLATYVSPVIGALPVQQVETDLITKILRPIWNSKPETAKRVRGRVETVLNFATANGYRKGENPARWKGHLDHILPKRGKDVQEHQPALPYERIGEFMPDLRSREGLSAIALEFAILTATRSGETRQAQWPEFDLAQKIWDIPADRMKGKRPHRVALSARAVAILRELEKTKSGPYVFGGSKPISDMAMTAVIRRMNASATKPYVDPKQNNRGVVPHGFRSTFKDWARERTSFANEISEAALAHINGDKVEAAYARGDMLEKRRKLMEAWAGYCATAETAGDVVSIRRAAE